MISLRGTLGLGSTLTLSPLTLGPGTLPFSPRSALTVSLRGPLPLGLRGPLPLSLGALDLCRTLSPGGPLTLSPLTLGPLTVPFSLGGTLPLCPVALDLCRTLSPGRPLPLSPLPLGLGGLLTLSLLTLCLRANLLRAI